MNRLCKVCNRLLPLSSFGSYPYGDGLHPRCKGCRNAAARKRYKADAAYRNGVLKACKTFAKSAAGRAVSKKARAKYIATHADKVKSRQILNNAITYGKFPGPMGQVCAKCAGAATEYHHPDYSPGNEFKVIAVCKDCHERIHHTETAVA